MKQLPAIRELQRHLMKGEELALLFLRVGVGVIFVVHGAMKLSEPMETTQQMAQLGFPLPGMAMILAILGEFVGGLGLTLGALTRIAALGPLLTMGTAILAVHLGHGLFNASGGWEYPLTLLLVSLVFAVRGGGEFSVDSWVRRAGVGEPIGPLQRNE